MSTSSKVSRRYARALFDVAKAAGQVDAIGTQLRELVSSWEASRELRVFFSDPRVGLVARRAVIEELAQKMPLAEPLKNVLLMLTDRARTTEIPGVAAAFATLAETAAGRVRARVVTVAALPEGFYTSLKTALERDTGKSVNVVREIDPSILGGVVTHVGDTVYDGSIRRQLAELRDRLVS